MSLLRKNRVRAGAPFNGIAGAAVGVELSGVAPDGEQDRGRRGAGDGRHSPLG
jgi:hypothetical protein